MRAVLLPGRAYDVDQPLLADTRRVLVERGLDVTGVRWTTTPVLQDAWVAARLAEAVGDDPGPVLVVGKSLGTRAASWVAGRGWPAIWLTPLLTEPSCTAGIRANPAPQLLVGGTADPWWDVEVARSLADGARRVASYDGADHGLLVEGRQRDVTGAVDDFVASWLG